MTMYGTAHYMLAVVASNIYDNAGLWDQGDAEVYTDIAPMLDAERRKPHRDALDAMIKASVPERHDMVIWKLAPGRSCPAPDMGFGPPLSTRSGANTGPAWSRTFEEKDSIEFTSDVYQMLTHTHLSSSLGLSAFGLVCSPRQPTPSRFPDLVDPFRTAPHAAVTMPSKELPEGASRRPPAAASAEFPRVSMRAQVRSASSR